MTNFNLYMDDVRPIPDGWTGARTVELAMQYLSFGLVNECSLDHDMGACEACREKGEHIGDQLTPETQFMFWCPHALDGTKLVRWMVETGHWPKVKPRVHSMNQAGAARMHDIIDQFFGREALGPMF